MIDQFMWRAQEMNSFLLECPAWEKSLYIIYSMLQIFSVSLSLSLSANNGVFKYIFNPIPLDQKIANLHSR